MTGAGAGVAAGRAGGRPVPTVSFGMPVYNCRATIGEAIETILRQSVPDFELVISDNGSTDGTAEICAGYAARDDRIRYIRQETNLGSDHNFEFVYRQARGEFFTWAPGHYSRSENFLEDNLGLLRDNPRCAFASSPNCLAGQEDDPGKRVTFSLEGSLFERVSRFLDVCRMSHACYYSVFRRRALEGFPDLATRYLANDWTLVLHLLEQGEFLRSRNSLLVVGSGQSKDPAFLSRSRSRPIHLFLPLWEFSTRFVARFGRHPELDWADRARLMARLARLNGFVSYRQFRKEVRLRQGRAAAR